MSDPVEFWDRQAADFDVEPDHGLTDPAVRAAWRDLLDRLLPDPPARVVDLGCGTGSLSVLMAGRGHAVTGVDFSRRMVEQARDKARNHGVDVDLRTADAADPGLPGASFDVVISRHVLWALADPARALQHWVELLCPGGSLVLIEGRWSTGTGLGAAQTHDLVAEMGREATIIPLGEPVYWGGPIDDERYVLVSPHRR